MPSTIFKADIETQELKQLSHFNDELLAGVAWPSVEEIYFEGAGGDQVQLFLFKPPDFDPSQKYPLVHLLHGGPHGSYSDSFSFGSCPPLMSAPGYLVACVNFHGSTTFGFDFLDSIAGAEGGKPFDDIMKATDYLISLGCVDPERIAVGGGSYGGYLTNWIITQTDRFACAYTHAGGFNQQGMLASDFYRYRERRFGAYPWVNQEIVDKWSPNRYSRNIETPTLIIHGDRDYRVPVTQALELYNTMKLLGMPARLLIFPDESHIVSKPLNHKKWFQEIHAWLQKWFEKSSNQ